MKINCILAIFLWGIREYDSLVADPYSFESLDLNLDKVLTRDELINYHNRAGQALWQAMNEVLEEEKGATGVDVPTADKENNWSFEFADDVVADMVDSTLKDLDSNHDGKLSKEEWGTRSSY